MKEFKKFISKGNVLEMAVGLILATYFGAIVKSLVNDIIMPPIGKLMGGIDFKEMKYVIQDAAPETAKGAGDALEEIAINYGMFINTILTFFIVAFSIFLVVKAYNRMKDRMLKKEEEDSNAPRVSSNEEILLTEIRDLLKK